jgi:hypothetical protein
MLLNVNGNVFAYIAHSFVAALNSVFFTALNSVLFAAININSDSFIAAWYDSFTFARNGGILHTYISILVHVFVRLYMCVDMHMRSNDIACIVEDDDRRNILCIGVHRINQVFFFTELEPSSSAFSAPIDDILPTCDCDCDYDEDSFASRGFHIRADAIIDISHNVVFYFVQDVRISDIGILFYLVENVRVSNVGILFGIVKRAIITVITVDLRTLWVLLFESLFELKVVWALLKVVFKSLLRFFFRTFLQHLFGELIVVESSGDVNVLQSIKALVVPVLHFFWR